MLQDIPYGTLVKEGRAYEIMLLRDQKGSAFADIAKAYGLSAARVAQIYHMLKRKQMRLYVNHIAVALRHESTAQVRKLLSDVDECYQDRAYVCAYFEKKYENLLTPYRDGEPGMPATFVQDLPPFKRKLSPKTMARVIEMREAEKASFAAIAKELHITQAKARHTYEMFYHNQALKWLEALRETAARDDAQKAMWDYCRKGNQSVKGFYDRLKEEFHL